MKRPVNLLLLALLLVCALSLWWGREAVTSWSGRSSARSAPTSASSARPAATRPRTDPGSEAQQVIHLVILNGTEHAGLARQASLALSLSGCVTERLGNAPHERFPFCMLINRRLSEREARAFADRLGGLTVVEEKDSRTAEDVVLLLGADFARVFRALGVEPSP